mmetsp:Transcript_11145/g.19564  ORF Transcript_11145/g.19564 Transcript_11145/m.19564 type:complete len:267 (+) Transcript_11145:94-894(+)
MVSSSNNDEEYDSFLLDPDSLAIVRGSVRAGGGGGYGGGSRASRSAATTQLATDVGSTVGPRKNPFLKSITFFAPKIYFRRDDNDSEKNDVSSEGDQADDYHGNDDDEDDMTFEINDLTHWDIMLKDPTVDESSHQRKRGIFSKLGKVGDSFKKSKRPQLIVEDFEGLVEFSSLEAGDRLVSINKKKIRPAEYSADNAMAYMRQCLENDGVLHVTTENSQGQDTIINVTVIKPRPGMTYDDLGKWLIINSVSFGWVIQCAHLTRST